MIFANRTNMNPTKRKRPIPKAAIPPSIDGKKRVSFGDSSNTIHTVENFKLSLNTPSQHDKVWYGPSEMHRFYEENCAYQQKKAAAIAYKKACRRSSMPSVSKRSPSRSPTTTHHKTPRRPRRNSMPASSPPPPPPKDVSPKSSTQKELFEQQQQAIRNLRLASSTQYSNFLARNQQKDQAPVHKITRSTTEALAATRLPPDSRKQSHRRRQTRQPEIGRVRAVFFSG